MTISCHVSCRWSVLASTEWQRKEMPQRWEKIPERYLLIRQMHQSRYYWVMKIDYHIDAVFFFCCYFPAPLHFSQPCCPLQIRFLDCSHALFARQWGKPQNSWAANFPTCLFPDVRDNLFTQRITSSGVSQLKFSCYYAIIWWTVWNCKLQYTSGWLCAFSSTSRALFCRERTTPLVW